MKYLHTMIRISDVDASMHFFCDLLGMKEVARYDSDKGRFTLIFLAAAEDADAAAETRNYCLQLTSKQMDQGADGGRHFSNRAFAVGA